MYSIHRIKHSGRQTLTRSGFQSSYCYSEPTLPNGGNMNQIAFLITLAISFVMANGAVAKTPEADNSAQNKGAVSKEAVTADKQKNDKADVKILAEIRRAIEKEKGLSVDAKNVKVLFSDGLATLRGPVESEEEKAKIEQIAKGCAGVSEVKNQISIAPKKH